MSRLRAAMLSISLLSIGNAAAVDDPQRNRAFQDHVAYVATFTMPLLIEKCSTIDPAFMQKAAPAYFRYVNANQDRIERGRLLTLAEFAADETLQTYRKHVIESRLGALDSGAPERVQKMCDRALSFLDGAPVPGEWPPRD